MKINARGVTLCGIILALTIADGLCTSIGVLAGLITEANPIFASAMQSNPFLSGFIAVLFTAVLMAVVIKYGGRCRCAMPLLAVVTIVKVNIIALHINWIAQII